MRSIQELCALCVTLLSGAILMASGCSLIDSGNDCKASCDTLVQCGQLHTSDCGAYCAGLVTGAVIAGCNDKFDAQNACAKSNPQCTAASAATCAPETEAFAQCMKDYCAMTPDGQGCPQVESDAGT